MIIARTWRCLRMTILVFVSILPVGLGCTASGYRSPAYLAVLSLGSRGAEVLAGKMGARLYAMHAADVSQVVRQVADSIAVAKELDPRCTRFFELEQSIVVLLNRFCAAGDQGRAYDAAFPILRFSPSGEQIGGELQWRADDDVRIPKSG